MAAEETGATQQQLLFILNEAPVGLFQAGCSKNRRVTLRSDWWPSGGRGGRNTIDDPSKHH